MDDTQQEHVGVDAGPRTFERSFKLKKVAGKVRVHRGAKIVGCRWGNQFQSDGDPPSKKWVTIKYTYDTWGAAHEWEYPLLKVVFKGEPPVRDSYDVIGDLDDYYHLIEIHRRDTRPKSLDKAEIQRVILEHGANAVLLPKKCQINELCALRVVDGTPCLCYKGFGQNKRAYLVVIASRRSKYYEEHVRIGKQTAEVGRTVQFPTQVERDFDLWVDLNLIGK